MREPTRTPFDLRGLILSGTALASLMFGIEMASRGVGSQSITFGLVGVGRPVGRRSMRCTRGIIRSRCSTSA